jgi:serine protease AprX
MLKPGKFSLISLFLIIALVMNLAVSAFAQDLNANYVRSMPEANDPVEHSDKLSPELLMELADGTNSESNKTVRVIVQTRATRDSLAQKIEAQGGHLKSALPLIDGFVVEVPRDALLDIAADSETDFVSLDRETNLLQTRYDHNLVLQTTGARNVVGRSGIDVDEVRDSAVRQYLRSLPDGPNGNDIAIAIFDSGIYDYGSEHQDLRAFDDLDEKRLVKHVNFVSGENPTSTQWERGYDPYGHGTHVAGIAAGSGYESIQSGSQAGNVYSGIAFNADLLDVRVIGANGTGRISDTIAAINWMISNRYRYNIRVANFSIGAAVTQSYRTDPLCQAVERAVNAGIVCVVAAGNFGKDELGNPVYGSILAPGNLPSVITVGAENTQGSIVRSDDTIASYSSRGPTLIDCVAKPDLVAPGTLIRSIAANRNYLATNHNLTVYSRNNEDVYMWLSGTSMAAPVVSGTIALMLEENPDLTPSMVKSILQFTAQPLASLAGNNALINLLTEGAGALNTDAAVRLASVFEEDADRVQYGSRMFDDDDRSLYAVLYASQDRTGAFTSQIGTETIQWGNNVFYSHGLTYFYDNHHKISVYRTAAWQASSSFTLHQGVIFTGGRLLTNGRLLTAGRLLTGGLLATDGRLLTGGLLMTDGWFFNTDVEMLVDTSVVQPVWAANLLDQSQMSSSSIFNTHAASEDVRVHGEDAVGREIPRITSENHPLFPRGNH